MLISFVTGATGIILRVHMKTTAGLGMTGISSASAGLIIAATADNEAVPTSYTQAGGTIDAITTPGTYAAPAANHCAIKKLDDAAHPGIVEIQLANTRYAVNGAKSLLVSWSGVSGMADSHAVIPLTAVNPYSATAFLTSVPTVVDKAGYALAAAGLDAVPVETGINARQALAIIGSAAAMVTSDASVSPITFYAMALTGTASTPRIVATNNSSGTRTGVTLTPPS